MSEPCPFCGARIKPIKVGEFKKCPVCGGTWYESGGGSAKTPTSFSGGGGAEVAVV